MARRPQLSTEVLRPVAAPVDTFVQPAPSPLHDVAKSLASLSKPLAEFLEARAEKAKEEDDIRGEAAFYEGNAEGLAEGVRLGKIPAQYSPAFVRGFKRAQGDVEGNNLEAEFSSAFDAWDGKNSEDPDAYDQFFAEWVKDKIGTDDPDVLKALQPHIRALHRAGTERFIQYRHDQTYGGALDANVAGAVQEVDKASLDGLSNPKGTDYPAVFKAIDTKREAFVAGGGRPADFDKAITDAMSAKILETRDPGLLKWFDQKVPGEDYTWGETPYGLGVKQNTVDALEVIGRRYDSEEYTRQQRENEVRKDAAHRQTIELLSKDPNAPLPDGLIADARKYDPTFDVRVAEWRKTLGSGITDQGKLKAVYSAILEGGGFKAVKEAADAGVFGRTEDLTAAYNFAKGFEDNKDRMGDVLGSAAAKKIMEAIDVRTKGRNKLQEPISGLSNEGFEATYDFRRLVQDWVMRKPDFQPWEVDEAVNSIGKLILDKIELTDPLDETGGTYDRPAEIGERFANPYSKGTAPISPPTDNDIQRFLGGLTPEQRAALDQEAAARGATVEDLARHLVGNR